ncbi:MAG TPA: MFS transporter [Ramlibacter sp.]|nr:MFS transporter [Ramlibacter sp.]
MPAEQADSRFSWWVAGTAVAMGALSFGAVTSVPILLKPLSQDWRAGASTVSLVHTSAMFGAAIGSLVLGRMLDRVGFFAIGLFAAMATGLGLLLAASAQNLLVLHLLYGVLIGGIGQGAFFSPLTAAVSQWFNRHRGIAIAFVACGQSVGGLVLPPLMRWGVDADGWRGTLAVYGLAAGIALVACSFAFRRAPPQQVAPPEQSAGAALPHPPSRGGFLMLGLCMALSNHASFIVIAHLTAFGEERGFAPAAAAAAVSAMLGVSLVSRLSVGQLSARWGSYNILLAMSVLLAIGTGILALAQGPIWIGSGAVAMGLAFGGYLPGYAILVRELFPAAQAGRRISEIYFFAFVAAGIGSWTGGWTRDFTSGYAVPFWIAAASAIAGAVMLLPCRSRLHRSIR